VKQRVNLWLGSSRKLAWRLPSK